MNIVEGVWHTTTSHPYVAHSAGTLLFFGQVIIIFLVQSKLQTCVTVMSYNKAGQAGFTAANFNTNITSATDALVALHNFGY